MEEHQDTNRTLRNVASRRQLFISSFLISGLSSQSFEGGGMNLTGSNGERKRFVSF